MITQILKSHWIKISLRGGTLVFTMAVLLSLYLFIEAGVSFSNEVPSHNNRVAAAEPAVFLASEPGFSGLLPFVRDKGTQQGPVVEGGVFFVSEVYDENAYWNETDEDQAFSDVQRREEPSSDRLKKQGRGIGAGQPSSAAASQFVLSSVIFKGVSVYESSSFTDLYLPLLARTVTIDELEGFLRSITHKYHEAGYIFAKAALSPQDLENGILEVQVFEGYIEDVVYRNSPSFTVSLAGYEQQLLAEKPLHRNDLERFIQTINNLNGIFVQKSDVTLSPGKDGAYILTLELSGDKYGANLYFDNRGSANIGKLQSWIGLQRYSLLKTGDRLQFGAFLTPENPENLTYLQLSYSGLAGTRGTVFNLTFDKTFSNYLNNFDNSSIDYDSLSFRFHVAHPVVMHSKSELWIWGALAYFDSRQNTQGNLSYKDKIRSFEVGASLSYRDDWDGYSNIRIEGKKGLGALGASDLTYDLTSRFDADGTFTKAVIQISRDQKLGQEFSLFASLIGQLADNPLLSSQEFALGGNSFAKAFDNAEISGDDGFAALLELRYSRETDSKLMTGFQVYGFIDTGSVWNDNFSAEFRKQSLTSAGGGMRANIFDRHYITLELAKPLNKPVYSTGSRSARFFFSVNSRF